MYSQRTANLRADRAYAEPMGFVGPDGNLAPVTPPAAPAQPLMVLVPYDPRVHGALVVLPSPAAPQPLDGPYAPDALERNEASGAHTLALLLGPLYPLCLCWSSKAFVRHHARRSVNVSLTSSLGFVALILLALLCGAAGSGWLGWLFFVLLAPALLTYEITGHLVGSGAAGRGSWSASSGIPFLR